MSFFIGTVIFIVFSNLMGSDYGPHRATKLVSMSSFAKWLSFGEQSRKLSVTKPLPFEEPMPNMDSKKIKKVVGTIDDYLSSFIDKLVNIRTIHLKNLQKDQWNPLPETTDLVDADSRRFLTQIRNLKEIQTITINISHDDFLVKFPWIGYDYGGNDCNLIEMTSEYGNKAQAQNAGYGERYYRNGCQNNITSLIRQISFEDSILDIGYLPLLRPRKEERGDIVGLTYLHIAQNAIVTMDGDVFVDRFKISPQRCWPAKHTGGKPEEMMQQYEEVFTIAQFWGEGFFHFMNEEFPRIAAWVPFLKRYPEIKIHVNSQHGFIISAFQALGLSPDRIIEGNIQAQLVHSPAGTPCGAPTYFNTKLLSLRLQENVGTKYVSSIFSHYNNGSGNVRIVAAPGEPPVAGSLNIFNRSYIILIKRSTKRFFMYHSEIYKELVTLGDSFGLQVKVFDDTMLPSYRETVELFHNAIAVVGPHGAGFSNMFYCQPGTIMIEGLCYFNGMANLCYRNLAKNIGLRYYGVLINDDCLMVRAKDVVPPLERFLKLLRKNR